MTKKGKFFVGIALIVGAVGYLMYTGIRETSMYYLTIEEFLAKREALANEGVRVAGRVQAGSMNWDPKDLHLSFLIGPFKEGEAVQGVPVRYQGILPDMFAEGRDVIIEGRYSTGNVLEARTIMTSCPSKYEPEKTGVRDQGSGAGAAKVSGR
jgi:cytochrome c-type biogenesis protein CcmE